MKSNRGIAILLLFLFCQVVWSQTEKESKPLIAIIEQLESQFDCRFSYADNMIDAVSVSVPSSLTTLEEIVDFLQDNTLLNFTILQDNVIAVSSKNGTVSICGYLLDIDTGEPISNVAIQSVNNATVSRSNGYFELKEVAANSLISVKHISYKSVKYVANRMNTKNCESYFLVANVEQINEILIRNYLTKGIRKTNTGSFDIDYVNFDILPGLIEHDVLQTIQALPGIQSADETVSNINIRGGSNAENLLLWDGIKMYQSGHFFGLISSFNPHLTKNAVLIKNGTNANYTDGVSGTILMNTDQQVNNTFNAEVGINLINADALVNVPIGAKSSVQLAARKSINGIWETPTYKQYFEKAFQNTEVVNDSDEVIHTDDSFSFYDVNISWLYDITASDKIRVNLLNFNNELAFLENAIVNEIEESKESSAEQQNLAASVFYDKTWTDDFTSQFQFYTTKYQLTSTNHDILNNQRLIQQNEVAETSVKLDTDFKLSNKISWFNGYQYFETGITNIQDVDNPLYYSRIKEVIRSHGLASQIGYQSEDNRTYVRVGARLNYLEKFGMFFLEPRLSLSQQFLTNFRLEVLGEFKHQTTSQVIDFQEDFLGVENRRWLLSNNDDIPIIKSKQASVGAHYNKKGWLVSVEGYYKEVDGITSQSQGFQNQYQYVKTDGSYTVFGADFLVNKRFRRLNTSLSYSYVDNEYTFEEFVEQQFPNNVDITHTVTAAFSYSIHNFMISAGFNWHSGKPTTLPVEGNEIIDGQINYEAANSSRLDDYMRVDASAQYQFSIGKKVNATTSISVWNLLNQENTINNYFRIADNNTVDEVVQKSLGLTPNVSFRVAF